MSFSERIEKASRVLANFAKAIEDKENLFTRISENLTDNDIRYCFIGGAVLPIYNYERYTEDIDILIDSRDKEKFLKSLSKIGFRPHNRLSKKKFYFESTPIDIIFSGEPSDYDYPYPESISEVKSINGVNCNFVSLFRLIEIKLTSGYYGADRKKDIGDVEELIKANNLKSNFLDKVSDKFIISKYKEMIEESEKLKKMTPLERKYYIQNKHSK